MSYDATIKIDAGSYNVTIYNSNYTYNVSNMFEEAIGDRLTSLNDKSCIEVIPILSNAIREMQDNMNTYKEMEPTNGWGSYEGALEFLIGIRNACADYWKGTVNID